jgi:SNF2 family DNA or RNA helicase
MHYSSSLRTQKFSTYIEGVFNNELTEESNKVDIQPSYIKPELYTHQKTLLAAAMDLERKKFTGIKCDEHSHLYTNFGILADRVGSGKSLVALSLVKHIIPDEREIQTIHRGDDVAMIKYITPNNKNRRVKTALFIIPHSLMGQWEDYVTRDTTLNVMFCRRKKEACDPTIVNFIDTVDAIFVTSTMYKFFDENVKPAQYHWSRIFIDEADSIQSPIYPEIGANFIWLITASYLNIAFPSGIYSRLNGTTHTYFTANNLKPETLEKIQKISGDEFRVDGIYTNAPLVKSLVGVTDVFKNSDLQSWRLVLRNSDIFIDQSFEMPPLIKNTIICRANTNVTILESLVQSDVMEMLHAGDTKSALQALGIKDETPTSIIDSLTKTLRRELEQTQKRFEFFKTQDYSSEIAKQKSLEGQEQKIASLLSRIETIEKRVENINTTNCPVCYGDIVTPTITPCCKNLFCFECICESLKTQPTCPLCRAGIVSASDLQVISTNAINTIENNNMPKTKIEEFIHFIEKHPQAKILLFSGYDASFFQIMNELTRRNITFSAINGSTARVSKILTEFSQGNYRVLMLNSKHVGSGLNIVTATDVFLFHKMGSEMEKQIIGRAYRMGRTTPLTVHYLLHNSEK